jgi:predicted XRE-type DNA-binding protein
MSLPIYLISQVKSLYEGGLTQVEIGQRFGVSQKTIHKFMQANGIKARVAVKRDQRGNKNSYWKGSAVTYKAAHQRVEALRGKPKSCETCGITDPTKRYEWASLTKNYLDPYDYKRLCKTCHVAFDKLMHSRRKLSESQVKEIKQQIQAGVKQSMIAATMKISRTVVNHIAKNRIYKEISA